jgi:hypothetical protein
MAALKDDLLHLDRIDAAALTAESPADAPSLERQTARGIPWTPRAVAIAGVAALAALALGVAIGRLLVNP